MAVIASGDTVRVINKGSKKMVIGWNNRYYTLLSGKDSHVPIEAVINAFGDPRAGGNAAYLRPEDGGTGMVPDRASEIRRLAQLYGIETQELKDHASGDRESIRPIPEVEVFTLNGERLYTVLEDIPGDWTLSTEPPTHSDAEASKKVIEHLQRQVEYLMQLNEGNMPGRTTFKELPNEEVSADKIDKTILDDINPTPPSRAPKSTKPDVSLP